MNNTTTCSRCHMIIPEGRFCDHCAALKRRDGTKLFKWILITLLVITVWAVLAAIFGPKHREASVLERSTAPPVSAPVSRATAPTSPAISEAPASSWSYSNSEDEMGRTIKLAYVISSNQLYLDFPYAGAQHATLTIRRRAGSDNVILKIEKGQLTCGSYGSRGVNVRFDEKPPRRFGVSEPADGDSTVVFLNNESAFIAEAKKAKRIRIEAIVYQNGSQIFDFNAAGLSWGK